MIMQNNFLFSGNPPAKNQFVLPIKKSIIFLSSINPQTNFSFLFFIIEPFLIHKNVSAIKNIVKKT